MAPASLSKASAEWPAPLIRDHILVSNLAIFKLSNGNKDMARKGRPTEEVIAALRG